MLQSGAAQLNLGRNLLQRVGRGAAKQRSGPLLQRIAHQNELRGATFAQLVLPIERFLPQNVDPAAKKSQKSGL